MPGVISAGSPDTAKAGAEILKQGGNAIDAAVAASFASFIAETGVVNLGGSGIAHIYDPQFGTSQVYDFWKVIQGLKLYWFGFPNNLFPLSSLTKLAQI